MSHIMLMSTLILTFSLTLILTLNVMKTEIPQARSPYISYVGNSALQLLPKPQAPVLSLIMIAL